MEYEILKCLHILSSTIFFGTGIGSAFFMFVANRRGEIHSIYFATRNVVLADLLFTTPAVIVQIATGTRLLYLTGYSFADLWVAWGVSLFGFAVACWLPVIWMQIRMRDLAKQALQDGTDLPALYWKLDKGWIILGSLALPAIVAVFYLMVAKG
jgi:uncharacterized membrane protein